MEDLSDPMFNGPMILSKKELRIGLIAVALFSLLVLATGRGDRQIAGIAKTYSAK